MDETVSQGDPKQLIEAIPLQVHRKTNSPDMSQQLFLLLGELIALRKEKGQQVRKAKRVKQHLKAVILDLWVAANYYPSPWRFVSRNRNDYTKESRYRKIFLKFDLLMGVLDDLIELGYIEQKLGFFDKAKGVGYQTRIKASENLLAILDFDIKHIVRNPEAPEEEVIILRDEAGKLSDYLDDQYTNEMRQQLTEYNNSLRNTSIDTGAIDLKYKHDPTNITVKRIFKKDFGSGGRFYGGFWENMPREDRLKLMLEGGAVVELDYANLHPRIAYAMKGIAIAGDLYSIDGCSRSEVKKAFQVLFNCESRKHAINTVRSLGIKNVEQLLTKIEEAHEQIKASFYNPPFGMVLQNTDAWIAERVLKKMAEQGIPCLPIHDSFIVGRKYEAELHEAMDSAFYEIFLVKPLIK